MLKFPHCASCTVISGCVLSGQRVQLQEELVLGCVSSDGDAALIWWVVIGITKTIYVPYPLQLLLWGLPDPVPGMTSIGNGVTGDRAGEGQRLWWLHQARSRLLKLNLGQNSFRQKKWILSITCCQNPTWTHVWSGNTHQEGLSPGKEDQTVSSVEYTSFSPEVSLLERDVSSHSTGGDLT